MKFVPRFAPVELSKFNEFAEQLWNNRPFLVITGAGISTESGIPDYRSAGVGLYATSKNRPIQFQVNFITQNDNGISFF